MAAITQLVTSIGIDDYQKIGKFLHKEQPYNPIGYGSDTHKIDLNMETTFKVHQGGDFIKLKFLNFEISKEDLAQGYDFLLDFRIDGYPIFQLPKCLIPEDSFVYTEKDSETHLVKIIIPWELFSDKPIPCIMFYQKDTKRDQGSVVFSSPQKLENITIDTISIFATTEERDLLSKSTDFLFGFRYLDQKIVSNNVRSFFEGINYGHGGVYQGFFGVCPNWKENLINCEFVMNGHPDGWGIIKFLERISDDVFYFPFDLETSWKIRKVEGFFNSRRNDAMHITVETTPEIKEIPLYFLAHNILSKNNSNLCMTRNYFTKDSDESSEKKLDDFLGLLIRVPSNSEQHIKNCVKNCSNGFCLVDVEENNTDTFCITEINDALPIILRENTEYVRSKYYHTR